MVGAPVFRDDQTVVASVRPDASGVLTVTWLAVGLDAHPVQGQFYFGVRTASSSAALRQNLNLAANRVGSFESGAGSAWLTGVIEAGRSIEILVLYVVLGAVMIATFILRPRGTATPAPRPPTGPGAMALLAPTVMTASGRREHRLLFLAGLISVALMPLLFWLYAARLTELLAGVGTSRILLSSIGAVWASKLVLWIALVAVVALIRRRGTDASEQGDRLRLLVPALALALAAAFVAGTHVGTGSASPQWLYIPMMLGHVLLTAFWAGGLMALLVLVFPTRDPDQIWSAVTRFSRFMSISLVALLATGVVILLKLLNNLNALWCTGYGVVAGFKVLTVTVALVAGLVNNRLVAAHRGYELLPEAARRMSRRRGPSLSTLRRIVACEAGLLLGALVLAAVLGETQLPPLFTGRALPGDVQTVVEPGLFGSGCQ